MVLHVRRSADRLLKHLREVGGGYRWRGIAHAFNGSAEQAGFSSTWAWCWVWRRRHLRARLAVARLASQLPLGGDRAGEPMPRHSPVVLRVAAAAAAGRPRAQRPGPAAPYCQVVAQLRGMELPGWRRPPRPMLCGLYRSLNRCWYNPTMARAPVIDLPKSSFPTKDPSATCIGQHLIQGSMLIDRAPCWCTSTSSA